MTKAKHYRKSCFSLRFRIIIAMAVLLLMAATSSLLFAKYIHSSGELENRFTPSAYDSPAVTDSMTKDVTGYYYKHDLSVTPAAGVDYPVYVRVALIPTWQDSSGNILGQQPVRDKDYSITYNENDWFVYTDGYYYCKTPVTGGTASPELITHYRYLKQLRDAPKTGYELHVEVVAETIQAVGTKYIDVQNRRAAVLDAWGVNPSVHN